MSLVSTKSKAFAVRIIRLYQYLCSEKREFVISKQLLRSGTSIGANLAEADYAISRSDFLSKLYNFTERNFGNIILAGFTIPDRLSDI